MDGLVWATGCGPTIELAEQTVLVRGRRLRDYGGIEAEILRRRGNPFDLLRYVARERSAHKVDDGNLLTGLFDDITARWCSVSSRDIFDWLDTWPGRVFALWLSVNENDPRRFTLDYIVRNASDVDWRSALQAMELASGADERATIDALTATEHGDGSAIPWPTIFRRLAEQPFSMTPDDIGNLTLRQLRTYLVDPGELSNRINFESTAEINEWGLRRKNAVVAAVHNIRRGTRWDAQIEN